MSSGKDVGRRVFLKKTKSLVIFGVGASLVLSGCQTSRTVDRSDVCYPYVEPISNAQSVVGNSTFTGAAIGAIAGGILGAMLGGDARSAAAGAALGGAAGGLAGNQYGTAQSERARADLLAELNQKASGQTVALGRASGAISRLTDCRKQEIESVRNLVSSGSLPEEDAKSRLMAIRAKVQQDNMMIADVLGDAEIRLDEYVKVAGENGLEREHLIGDIRYEEPLAPGSWSEPGVGSGKEYVAKTASRVRSKPTTSGSVLGVLAPGDKIVAAGETSDGWTSFTYNGRKAFVSSSLLKPSDGEGVLVASAEQVPAPVAKNKVEELAINTQKVKAAQQGHEELSSEIDDLFAALNA